ncbi:MAG TPA: transposase [Anaerolineae bacterium]|nr:transposase [Anaerolineae bacterium]
MSRSWRIEFKGALYHVLSRGNEQQDIFGDDEDRNCFIRIMGEMSDRFDVNIFAYVLMDNHYHILLRTNNPNLSKAMQWLGVTYTRRFNNRHARSGHLFQGRFKSLIVENDAYLVRLSCYIHRNPLRAGIVKRLINYKWSSYPVYAYNRKYPEWLKTDTVLSQLGTDNPQLAYRKKVQRYSKEEASLFEELRYGLFFGTAGFADRLKSGFLPDFKRKAHPELPQQIMLLKKHEPEKLLRGLSDALECDLESFRESLRIPEKDKVARDLMIYFLWQTGRFTNQKISGLFGLSYSSVSRRVAIFREKLRVDKTFKKEYGRISELIKM